MFWRISIRYINLQLVIHYPWGIFYFKHVLRVGTLIEIDLELWGSVKRDQQIKFIYIWETFWLSFTQLTIKFDESLVFIIRCDYREDVNSSLVSLYGSERKDFNSYPSEGKLLLNSVFGALMEYTNMRFCSRSINFCNILLTTLYFCNNLKQFLKSSIYIHSDYEHCACLHVFFLRKLSGLSIMFTVWLLCLKPVSIFFNLTLK